MHALARIAAQTHIGRMLRKTPFILPSAPVLKAPPSGAGWIHEIKFDGWRVQLHKDGEAATLYSQRGYDLTRRFP